MKRLLIGIMVSILLLAGWGCDPIQPEASEEESSIVSKSEEISEDGIEQAEPSEIADNEAHTNQEVRKQPGWRQIVKDSQFQLDPEIWIKPYDETKPRGWGFGTYPRIDGSTVAIPMLAEFAWQHLGLLDTVNAVENFCWVTTTSTAYEGFISRYQLSHLVFDIPERESIFINSNEADILIATEPSKENLARAAEEGVTLVTKPVCMDAFVFIVNKDNPVESLTVEQIQKIYAGEITNWEQVGGRDEAIKAYQRSQNSGSQTAMETMVMKGKKMVDPPLAPVIDDMDGLVKIVGEGTAAYEGSATGIGYTYKFYIDNQYKNDNIKTISVNGIAPTDDDIRSKTYPFVDYYYGVIRGGEEEEVGGRFLDWMLSDEGQQCIKQAGYISLR